MRTPATTESRWSLDPRVIEVHRTRGEEASRLATRACVPRFPLLDSSFLSSSSSGTIAYREANATITRRKSRTKDRPAGVLTPRLSVSSIVPPTRVLGVAPVVHLLSFPSSPSFLSIDRSLFDRPQTSDRFRGNSNGQTSVDSFLFLIFEIWGLLTQRWRRLTFIRRIL